MGLQGFGYKLDIVFVIDATGSMGPIMNQVKAQALSLGDKINSALGAAGKPVDSMRMRVVDFGDYATEGDDAIRQTDFFTIPADKQKFEDHVNALDYDGRGGDIPENALEALFVAMSSDWVKINTAAGEKGRHIIVLMTDAYPLNLQERKGCYGYPEDDFPADIAEMEGIWSASAQDTTLSLSPASKRLILFVPEGADAAGHSWDSVSAWENTTTTAVDPMNGLGEFDVDAIISEIVRSV